MTKYYEYVGKAIRERRNELKLSQQTVADRIGVTRGAYSQYETGKNAISMEVWFKIAEVLKLDPDDIPAKALHFSNKK
ncbi:MAG: helix-turn-helix transcriptional regulator [Eubacterium sp.]|nr:helix-turn-helix transcriptional regulator [Eubacterium sp.]MBQ9643635.1 helix-turn-helix transcriptional regulator [Lachnospiraceae bacterium]